MVICKSFAENSTCQKFKMCPNEHINVKEYVKAEMEAAINGNQWPLSCFGPFSDKPSVPNYIEDQSFEEVRFMYYDTEKCSFFESCQKFKESISNAKEKMHMLNAMDREVVDVLVNVYDYVEPPKKIKFPFEPNFGTNQVKWIVSNPSPSKKNMFKGSFPPPPPNPIFTAFPKESELKKFNFGFTSPPGKSMQQIDEKKDNPSGSFSPEPLLDVHEKQEKVACFFSSMHLLKLQEKQEKVSGFFSSEQLQKLQASAFRSKSGEEASTQTTLEKNECHDCKEQCKDLMAKMDTILSVMNETNEKSKEQEKQINSLMDSFKQIELGKEANKPKHNTDRDQETIIKIRPKFKQSSEKTKDEIKNILSPFGHFNLGLQISTMLTSAQGSITIRCKNKATAEKIENEIAKTCVEHYYTEPVKLSMPKILVNGIDFGIDDNKLIEAIKKQNEIEGHIKLVRSFERESVHKYNAVLEVDKDIYWSIMRNREPHLYVGWKRCIVFESIDIKRCNKCWGYNHHSRVCRNEKRCPKCAGQHSENECKSHTLRCANCSMANVRMNLKLDLEHDVRNYQCYVYLSKVERERKMIDY